MVGGQSFKLIGVKSFITPRLPVGKLKSLNLYAALLVYSSTNSTSGHISSLSPSVISITSSEPMYVKTEDVTHSFSSSTV